MKNLGFFYDMDRCTGCRACQVACKEEHGLSVGEFDRRVDSFEAKIDGQHRWIHFSAACNHCRRPACVEVCPTGAMYRAEDGTVQHRDDLCIGCGRCVHRCPYGAPSLNRYTGYAQKCDACAQRRSEGRAPACVEACPMRALHFGDMEALRAEFGTHGAALPFLPAEEQTGPCLMVRGAAAAETAAEPEKKTAPPMQASAECRVVILGGGVAAVSAAKELRARTQAAQITLISREKRLPYCRPMLSKGLLNSFAMDRYPIVEEDWLRENRVVYMGGTAVTGLDGTAHTVALENGQILTYDKCIYALGAECFVPPIAGRERSGVYTLRSDTDLHQIRQAMLTARRAVVIGGGITGLELAWELKKAGIQVTVLDAMEQLLGRILDPHSAQLLRAAVEAAGICVKTGVRIKALAGEKAVEEVVLEEAVLPADMVILSTGYRANTALAEAAGLAVQDAVTVNEHLETSDPDIYACGDCTDGRTASWLRSVHQGQIAAANALGAQERYAAQAEPAIMHTAGVSLLAVGDLGKLADREYRFVYGRSREKTGLFYVNKKSGAGSAAEFTFCFCGECLCGAATVGALESMLWLQQAVEEGWQEERLRACAKEKGVEIDGI